MNTGVNVGVTQEAIAEMRAAILSILQAGRGDSVTVSALETLERGVKTGPVTVQNLSVMGDRTEHHTHHATPVVADEED